MAGDGVGHRRAATFVSNVLHGRIRHHLKGFANQVAMGALAWRAPTHRVGFCIGNEAFQIGDGQLRIDGQHNGRATQHGDVREVFEGVIDLWIF